MGLRSIKRQICKNAAKEQGLNPNKKYRNKFDKYESYKSGVKIVYERVFQDKKTTTHKDGESSKE